MCLLTDGSPRMPATIDDRPRRGIVLVLCLSMLSLFSVLVAGYVIFTSQAVTVSAIEHRDELPVNASLRDAVNQLISGTDNYRSVAYQESILEDMYGRDSLLLRVGNRRPGAVGGSTPINNGSGADARVVLLTPGATGDTLLIKFPTSLAAWHHDGSPLPEDTDLPILPGLFADYSRSQLRDTIYTNQDLVLDDVFTGRNVTFTEGPLRSLTFPIIRSFGSTSGDELEGGFVIDIGSSDATEVEVNSAVVNLRATALGQPASLFFDPGVDGQPGRGGNDDNDGDINEADELGASGSDDYGYRFVLSGGVFNGRGSNPPGTNGLKRTLQPTPGQTQPNMVSAGDVDMFPELQFNRRLIGRNDAAGLSQAPATDSRPEQDEAWDAPDFENLFLAWQPSDHRAVMQPTLYGTAANATQLQDQLGSNLIPSFHRPAVINYLMNLQVNGKTFSDIQNDSQENRAILNVFLARLRRATMRPLNVDPAVNGDMDANGRLDDGSVGFTGSNPSPFVQLPIVAGESHAARYKKVRELALFLTNGPWDVDNDEDGIPESVWLDFDLPTYFTSEGQQIRPLVAPLIEDLDGRVNLNYAGNFRQMLVQRYPQVAAPGSAMPYGNSSDYFATKVALDRFGRGGGLGPAEIDFSHIFKMTPPSTSVGPILLTQTSPGLQPTNVLFRTYGNLMSTRYGGSPYLYPAPPLTPMAHPSDRVNLPGDGDLASVGSDPRGQIPYPARKDFHDDAGPMGLAMDIHGVSLRRPDRNGQSLVSDLADPGAAGPYQAVLNEINNQPYENHDGDTPFAPAELVKLLTEVNGGDPLLQLLDEEVNRNAALKSLITTDSRDVEVPELGDYAHFISFIREKFAAASGGQLAQVEVDKMVAPELRKGTRLNINRQLGNGDTDATGKPPSNPNPDLAALIDETIETFANQSANIRDRRSREKPFPSAVANPGNLRANYQPLSAATGASDDFDGIDANDDGLTDGNRNRVATGNELLARHLYCLMFWLIGDNSAGATELIPNFPYPDGFTTDVSIRNRYAARRLAQWAVNAVDARDTDAICTRLRYDFNPMNGYDLAEAAQNVVWGMERPEIEISETLAFHDKRLRRKLATAIDPSAAGDEEETDPAARDDNMDQFRIPQGSAFVELRSLRSPLDPSPVAGQLRPTNGTRPSLPAELYTNGKLDLGRIVGTGIYQSPVWRLAVGEPIGGDANKSIRWMFDAARVGQLHREQNLAGDFELQMKYLTTNAPDWTNAADVQAEVKAWRSIQAAAAEVRTLNPATGGEVAISDDNFIPSDDVGGPHSIRLQRFVWFTNTLAPTANLRVVHDPNVAGDFQSDMRPNNVFFRQGPPVGGDPNAAVYHAQSLLGPGEYAVIAPRITTHLGQTKNVTSTDTAYDPSPQRISLLGQDNGTNPPTVFKTVYSGLSFSTNPLIPRYADYNSGSAATANYHVNGIVPIIATAYQPGAVDNTTGSAWDNYASNTNNAEETRIGFNISEPLPGPNYYQAPTDKISTKTTATAGGRNRVAYPLVDGYRDTDDASDTDFFPNEPFDHQGGTPLQDNGWAGVGTYQEAVGIFLQRLADPTQIWDPVDNPYLTVDLAPMDLTTFNGEGDPIEEIDHDADPMTDDVIADREATTYDIATNSYTPSMRFDSRRKIPDTARDRLMTDLVQTGGGSGSTVLGQYDRDLVTQRPMLSASFNVLRATGPSTPNGSADDSVFDHPLGAMWSANHNPDDTGIDSRYAVDGAWSVNVEEFGAATTLRTDFYHPQIDTEPYRQTLGFVNREYGRPVGAAAGNLTNTAGSDRPDVGRLGRGSPTHTRFLFPQWNDRDYRSPMELISVPAASATGMLTAFSPGTKLTTVDLSVSPPQTVEVPAPFDHLLGFDRGIGRGAGVRTNYNAPQTPPTGVAMPRLLGATPDEDLSGERSPFELLFDCVSTGQPREEDNHWLDAQTVTFKPGNSTFDQMFNRTVEFLQPPYNYVPGMRTPGRVNLNTTPDFIRPGGSFATTPTLEYLDASEPTNSNAASAVAIQSTQEQTSQQQVSPAALLATGLIANGSIHRSLAWGGSTVYDLDDQRFDPTVLGEINQYQNAVDSSYGLGFKAFIESRRGYPSSMGSTGSAFFVSQNTNLDFRYPTQFAGAFGAAAAAESPSVQRFLRPAVGVTAQTLTRRTSDMTVMRPHPDFDDRVGQNGVSSLEDTNLTLQVENVPTGFPLTMPTLTTTPHNAAGHQMTKGPGGVFERSIADLHRSFRHLGRDSTYRYENATRMRNLTTHHSNVFLARMTVGFFVVDREGNPTAEFRDPDGVVTRGTATVLIDRSVPVGFLPGEVLNSQNTILYEVFND